MGIEGKREVKVHLDAKDYLRLRGLLVQRDRSFSDWVRGKVRDLLRRLDREGEANGKKEEQAGCNPEEHQSAEETNS